MARYPRIVDLVPFCKEKIVGIDMREYLENRLKFSLHELAQHAGEWVAWSPDGVRIVASSTDLASLDSLIRAAGEDPEQCPIEGIPDSDSVIGRSELSLRFPYLPSPTR